MQTPQIPIGSGFGAASTAEEVIKDIDLTGKNVIVTGGYSGIGLETVRVLRSVGAHVIVPARDIEKAQSALKDAADVEFATLDLLETETIRSFANEFLSSRRPLHLLINNAGIMANPLTRDKRGFESQFATNHLGHFELTTRLWGALVQARGARIVNLSSRGHFFSPVIFDDINFERRAYNPWLAYGQSKTANILFSVEADARGASDGIRAFAVHPGTIVDSNLKRYLSEADLKADGYLDDQGNAIIDPSKNRKTIAQGAATTVWCATNSRLHGMGGVYCENCDISEEISAELLGKAADGSGAIGAISLPTGVMPYAIDPESARQLWHVSERMLGLSSSTKGPLVAAGSA